MGMKGCDKLADAGRRAFFARTATAAVGVAASAALPAMPADAAPAPAPPTTAQARPARAAPARARLEYPRLRLWNIKELKVDDPKDITYPDSDSPGILLKLGHRVEGGAGPDGDIVAYSTMCPHKGFPLNYAASDRTLNCPGHYSRFDVEKGGLEIWGHAVQNLAQFRLGIDGKGDIYAESVDELIYGRPSNVLA